MIKIKCLNCGKEFWVKPYRKDIAKFCLYQCYWESLKGKPPTEKQLKALKKGWNKVITLEYRRKLSEALKGNTNCLGKKWTEEHRQKTIKALTGRKLTPEHIKKLSGENASNWKGGKTPENIIIRHNVKSRIWREAVFARDNWICQKYGTKGGELIAHHIFNFADYPKLRTSIENGITFSKKAHKEFHKKYGCKNNNKEQLEEFLKFGGKKLL